MCVCVLQKAADTQASPDGRRLGVSLHWTPALAAHWALTSTLNISQVSEQRYTPCTHTLSEIHFLTKKKKISNVIQQQCFKLIKSGSMDFSSPRLNL